MNQLRFTWRFRLDYRRSMRRGCSLERLKSLLALLRRGAPLPLNCLDTSVRGTKARACRVEPGWVLVYQTKEGMVTLLRMKYIPGKRPKAAPPMGLWFKTLLRSPIKTAITVLLLAAAAFLLLDNLSSYAMQTQAVKQAEEGLEGILTVERSQVNRPDDGTRSRFLLTDPTNPARNVYPNVSYENVHHEAISQADLEALEALPYIDAVDRRYMTAGLSEDYWRISEPPGIYSYMDRLVLEGTVAVVLPNEDGLLSDPDFFAGALNFMLEDVKVLAGDSRFLEEQLKAFNGRARVIVVAMPDQYLDTDPSITIGGKTYEVSCLNYDITRDVMLSIEKGRRYVFVVRAPRNESVTAADYGFYLGDDSREGWWPYFTDVTDLPENYLEGEEFAPLRELMQVTDDDYRTFDMVYTDDMASIRRVSHQQLTPVQGRFLGPEDEGKNVCVVNEAFLEENDLALGDTITLKLGNVLTEQFAALGAVAVTQGRHATAWEEQSFTIVGSWHDASGRGWREKESRRVYSTGTWKEQEYYWAYSENAIFVPSSFLPAGCDTENHLFRPAEVSFLVRNVDNIGSFAEECLPQVEALGLTYSWVDGNWPVIADKMAQTRSLTLMKLLIFTAASLLAAGLTVYLFLFRRKKEYAILRALGTPRKAAAKALMLPLLVLAAFSAALGIAVAWLRSGAAAAKSMEEFTEAGLEAFPAARPEVYLLGGLGLLLVILLFSLLHLRAWGKRSPLALLQDSDHRKGKAAGPLGAEITPAALAAAAETLSYPLSVTGKPVKGFLRRYVLRHIRRAGVKTLLSLLLAAILVGAVGQLTVLRSRYGELIDQVKVDVAFYDGLSLYRAGTLMKSGLVSDPVYRGTFRDAELEMSATRVEFTNRLDSVTSDPVTWLEGWDESSAMEETGKVCILPAPVMRNLKVQLGDTVRINEAGCIALLLRGHPEIVADTWEEQLAMRDQFRSVYTVIGRVETTDSTSVVYAPANAFDSFPFFGTTLYLDSATYVLNDYRKADELRQLATEIQYSAQKPPVFSMDTSDADRIYRVYRLIETLYPLTVAAALILGTLLPVLMILQEQKEAAILRALGWSKKLTIRRLTLEQALLCLMGLMLAIAALFAVNGSGFLGVILVPLVYVAAHFALCVIASAAISASILQKSPMRLLQVKE